MIAAATAPWSDVLEHVREGTSDSTVAMWFLDARLEQRGEAGYAVVVKSEFARHQVERQRGLVVEKLVEIAGRADLSVAIEVAS
ncbi:MAG: hypothetical protein M3T56_10290 [Chloroflexota bacterium]|nr:hypothetical protein [Chloroflexota bacterium]